MKRILAATVLATAALLSLAAAAFGLPPFTTAPKHAAGSGGQAQVSHLRTGCHATFDRLVLRSGAATPRYDVRYVKRIFEDASGKPVHLLGKKRIRILLRNTRGHTTGGTNLLPNVRTPRCPNLRQVKNAGDFEGVVTLGLGLRHKTGFRVFRLTGPNRLVVDIHH
jgi:hypothetical protein